jgi:cytochrome oxidase Cu insertion factor (SCO1/SenC/PrrC family)
MNKRLFYLFVAAGIVSAALVGALLAAREIASEPDSGSRQGGAGPYRGSEPPAGIGMPRFALRDVLRGRVVRTGDLDGRVVLVIFLDTDCSERCPIIAGQIGRALARLDEQERAKTTAVAISVNPLIDTRASVVRFLREYRVLGELEYLSGAARELQPVWRDFQIVSAYETGDADTHSADVRVFDQDGEWVATLHAGADLTPANLAHDVTTALESQT